MNYQKLLLEKAVMNSVKFKTNTLTVEETTIDLSQELRFYSFVNALYMKEIQWGIQSAHGAVELFNDYANMFCDERDVLFTWSNRDKTMIILNGGITSDLLKKADFFKDNIHDLEFPMPWAQFNEDEQSLGGVITNVCCVVPEMYFNAVSHATLLKMVFNKELKDPKIDYQLIESSFQPGDWFYVVDGEIVRAFTEESPDGQFISMMKSCNLAGR